MLGRGEEVVNEDVLDGVGPEHLIDVIKSEVQIVLVLSGIELIFL